MPLDRNAIEKGVAEHIETVQSVTHQEMTPKEREAIRKQHERAAEQVKRG